MSRQVRSAQLLEGELASLRQRIIRSVLARHGLELSARGMTALRFDDELAHWKLLAIPGSYLRARSRRDRILLALTRVWGLRGLRRRIPFGRPLPGLRRRWRHGVRHAWARSAPPGAARAPGSGGKAGSADSPAQPPGRVRPPGRQGHPPAGPAGRPRPRRAGEGSASTRSSRTPSGVPAGASRRVRVRGGKC